MNTDDLVRAVVQVGAEETPYLRCGRGGPGIVVLADDAAERLRLIRQYSHRGCVIAPVPGHCPDGTAEREVALEQWLRGVLEGLGLESPTVVVANALAALVPSLAAAYGGSCEIVTAPAAAAPSP